MGVGRLPTRVLPVAPTKLRVRLFSGKKHAIEQETVEEHCSFHRIYSFSFQSFTDLEWVDVVEITLILLPTTKRVEKSVRRRNIIVILSTGGDRNGKGSDLRHGGE
jgi:hypothetical protein